jgi:hypothetical protein
MTVALLFLIFAFVLFVLAGINVSTPRLSLGWLGMACLTVAIWLIPVLK